jgi:hypothetical protein
LGCITHHYHRQVCDESKSLAYAYIVSPIMSPWLLTTRITTTMRPRSLAPSTSTNLAKINVALLDRRCWTDQDTSNGSPSIIRGQPSGPISLFEMITCGGWKHVLSCSIFHGEQEKNRVTYSEYQQSGILGNRQRNAQRPSGTKEENRSFSTPLILRSRLRPLRIDRPSQSVDSSKGSQWYYP